MKNSIHIYSLKNYNKQYNTHTNPPPPTHTPTRVFICLQKTADSINTIAVRFSYEKRRIYLLIALFVSLERGRERSAKWNVCLKELVRKQTDRAATYIVVGLQDPTPGDSDETTKIPLPPTASAKDKMWKQSLGEKTKIPKLPFYVVFGKWWWSGVLYSTRFDWRCMHHCQARITVGWLYAMLPGWYANKLCARGMGRFEPPGCWNVIDLFLSFFPPSTKLCHLITILFWARKITFVD